MSGCPGTRRPASSSVALVGAAAAAGTAASLVQQGLFALPGPRRLEAGTAQPQVQVQSHRSSGRHATSARGQQAAAGLALGVAALAGGACAAAAGKKSAAGRGAAAAAAAGRARRIRMRDSPDAVADVAAAAVVPPCARTDAVHLTGETLSAVLKMRCEMVGADYAIFWVHVNGKLVVSSDYMTRECQAALEAAGKTASFAEKSEKITYPAMGTTHVSAVYNFGEPMFIADAASDPSEDFQRKELAAEYGVKSICFVPVENGVLEYGTTESWSGIPECSMLPKREMRNAFENLGAGYCMFWAEKDGQFSVAGSYCTLERRRLLNIKRGDKKTFCTESRLCTLDATGDGPMAAVAKYHQALFVTAEEATKVDRADLVKEFGIAGMHLIPVKGGVLECGIPTDARLQGNVLQSALKICCDNSGAGYGIYWTEFDGEFVLTGHYTSKALENAFKEKGLDSTFSTVSKDFKLPAGGSGPVAMTARFKEPQFIQAPEWSDDFLRKDVATSYGVESSVFVPVEGGVFEFGTTGGEETASWAEMPQSPDMPKDMLKKAFNEHEAQYAIFWCNVNGHYFHGGDYVSPEHLRALKNQRGDDTSFVDISKSFTLPPGETNYAWLAMESGKEQVVKNPASDPNLQRAVFAEEFKISEIHFVPCGDNGVLEFGKSSY